MDLLGDGRIDLTDSMGDVFYDNREISLPFFTEVEMSQAKFEREKTRIATFLHGKKAEMEFAIDPGYIYKGRVKMSEFSRELRHLMLVLTVDAEPYKTLGDVVFKANAAGGIKLLLDNGRSRTQPTVEVYNKSVLSFEGKDWCLEPGTWTIDDFWLHGGENIVVVNTTPDYEHASLLSFQADTLQSHANEILSIMSMGDAPLQVPDTLQDIGGSLWDIESKRLIDLAHPMLEPEDVTEEFGDTNVYFKYEWKDL